MPVNLELKVKVKSPAALRKLLKAGNARYEGVLNQKDIYYKFKGGLLKLRVENGNYQLIKYSRDEKGKRWSNYEILSLNGKNVEKYLLEFLKTEAVVQKKRLLYRYNNTRIHLDAVKGLGNFLELETLLTGSRKEAQEEFDHVVSFLKLNPAEQIRTSYKFLVSRK